MSTLPADKREDLRRLQAWALGAGIVALLVCLIAAPFSPAPFFRAYLAAYQLYLGIALGCLAILMLYHLTGGAWGYLTRRILEAGMRTLPLLALLFTPIAIGIRYVYPWARPEVRASDKPLPFNDLYLNPPFWWVRVAFFFAVWVLLMALLSAWSRRQDETGEARLPRKFRLLSAPGLVAFGVTITFASVDWVMSLQPTYHSTIFAPLFAVGQFVSAQAFVVIVLAWLVSRPPLVNVVSLETLSDVSNLLFTFLVIWAYMAFFEFMLIWIANLPEEVSWYLPRLQGGWQWVALAIAVLHFAVPFFLLLLRNVKRNPSALAAVAAVLLFMHLVFLYFQVLPAVPDVPGIPGTRVSRHWFDLLTPLGVGGIWLAYFLWQLGRFPVLPLHDLNRAEAAHLRRLDEEQAAREEAISHG
ncbi:MAG: hypothetical protein E6K70_01135 [Planctomycetota bacterium]|nr:MAG: hypothetical protein E6K70_01135 [Planctomycetota bacterium]